jgi:hypothetical protein
MLKQFTRISVIASVLLIFCLAQIPPQINYQGYLTDKDGNPLDGEYYIEFFIYDQTEGGTELWCEPHDVTVDKGSFNVILGSHNLIPKMIFKQDERYLAIKVGDDPIMSPRKKITSVGYAFKAANADSLNGKSSSDFVEKGKANAISTDMVQDNAITEDKIKPAIVSSIDSVKNDGGDIDLIAGNNITITPDNSNKEITISAVGGSGSDNLGNHTATNNLQMNGQWISNDGENEGIYVKNDGKVGVGTDSPGNRLEVAGTFKAEKTNKGAAVWGNATNTGDLTNYGGYFVAQGDSGKAVYGYAPKSGDVKNYGGYFKAEG